MYRVADIMTRKLVTLKPTDDLALADAIVALGRYRHLPVVEGHRLMGLITQRDLLRIWGQRDRVDARTALAGEVMTKDPMTVTPETPVFEAAREMEANKYGCLPVVEHGKLVGLVTETDFLRLAAHLTENADGPLREYPGPRA